MGRLPQPRVQYVQWTLCQFFFFFPPAVFCLFSSLIVVQQQWLGCRIKNCTCTKRGLWWALSRTAGRKSQVRSKQLWESDNGMVCSYVFSWVWVNMVQELQDWCWEYATMKKNCSDSAIWSVAGLLVLYELPLWLQRAHWKTWVTSAWPRDIFSSPLLPFFLEAGLDGRITAIDLPWFVIWGLSFLIIFSLFEPECLHLDLFIVAVSLLPFLNHPPDKQLKVTQLAPDTNKAKRSRCLITWGWIKPSRPRHWRTCRHSLTGPCEHSLPGQSVWPRLITSVCYSPEGPIGGPHLTSFAQADFERQTAGPIHNNVHLSYFRPAAVAPWGEGFSAMKLSFFFILAKFSTKMDIVQLFSQSRGSLARYFPSHDCSLP